MFPMFDKLPMRVNSSKILNPIPSLSRDEAKIPCFFSSLQQEANVKPGIELHSGKAKPEISKTHQRVRIHPRNGAREHSE